MWDYPLFLPWTGDVLVSGFIDSRASEGSPVSSSWKTLRSCPEKLAP